MRVTIALLGLWLGLAPIPLAVADSLNGELASRIELAMTGAGSDDEKRTLAQLEAFYRKRAMAPLWVTAESVTSRGREVATLLGFADADALEPEDYAASAIASLISSDQPDKLADLELHLSLGLVDFAADLGQGRVAPHISDPKLFVFRDEINKGEVIAAAAQAQDLIGFVDSYRPQTPRYDRLKAALAHYRALAVQGGWSPIPEGEVLKPGMVDPRVPQIRARLQLWGDLAEDAGSNPEGTIYDAALVAAVERMQWRHGLVADGVIGRKTMDAFNVPVDERVQQIVLNLERRRWMPDNLGRRFVFVNLADYELKFVDGEKTILDMRVVVGKPYHMTPVFSHEMTYVVVNPFWNVPPSIAQKELLPKIKKNANFIKNNNFTLFSDWSSSARELDPETVDWAEVNGHSFPYKLQQGPGDGNALGRMKFMFPNHFNVYLHDTPAKALFKKDQRSFSHGCIRVQQPEILGEVVLAETAGWPLSRIKEAIASDERQVITLSKPLPVHISYLTSWVNKDGSVHFRDDVYGRDEVLTAALDGASRWKAAHN